MKAESIGDVFYRTASTACPISTTNTDCRHCGLTVRDGAHPETGKVQCLDRHRREYRRGLVAR